MLQVARAPLPCPRSWCRCAGSVGSRMTAGALLSLIWLLVLPASAQDTPRDDSGRYWAYRAIRQVEPPAVAESDAATELTAIDRWLCSPAESTAEFVVLRRASRQVLLRRATFDLHGLPPTPEELEQFLSDDRPDAYEKLLDRLLASPRYGERWGRYWLDLVRFSDTAGYNADPLRPLAYQYRDYVIRAFNDDLPYDRFILEQLAGDELFPDSPQALIATGFLRMPPDESNASNIMLARQDQLNDITANVGAVFLGQSFGCAQCHDHKFDEITQRDFYRLQAFFAGIIPIDSVPGGLLVDRQTYQARLKSWEAESAADRNELHELETQARRVAGAEKRLKFPEIVLESIDTPVAERTALQHQLAFFAERQIIIAEKELQAALLPQESSRLAELRRRLKDRESSRPQPASVLPVMAVVNGAAPPATFLLAGGSYDKPRDLLTPGFPVCIDWAPDETEAAVPQRAALARWIIEPRNPLTARVMANRIWQGHFGRGLVENGNDLGMQTAPPTHPELLDWLAAELIRGGWSLKKLHKTVMLSAAYQQAPIQGAGSATGLPPFNRRRLDGEAIRDAMLSVSGLLNDTMYGPGVQPELPPNLQTREKWQPDADLRQHHRRSVYILAKRNLPYPFLNAFDFPDMHESCAARAVTTTAPQALLLLNSEVLLEYSQAFAGRLLHDHPQAEASLVSEGYRLAFARLPEADEIQAALEFIDRQQATLAEQQAAGDPLLLPRNFPKFLDPARGAAVVDFCHALLNANEFLYVD